MGTMNGLIEGDLVKVLPVEQIRIADTVTVNCENENDYEYVSLNNELLSGNLLNQITVF